jgi:hypothetical protein
VEPVEKDKLASMDDTCEYVVEGKNEEATENQSLMLTSAASLKTTGTRSLYNAKATATNIGLQVKNTFLMTAAGKTAPVFISVCGLNERELNVNLCPTGVLLLTIEGLCVGGGGVQTGVDAPGYVLFVCNDKDGETEKLKCRKYMDTIVFPFVDQVRKETDGWDPTMELDSSMKFVLWCDGDLAQLDVLTDPEYVAKFKEKLIVACKQNAARTGVEQAADQANVFNKFHQAQKKNNNG